MAGEKTFHPGDDSTEIASGPFPAYKMPNGPATSIPEGAQLSRSGENATHVRCRYQGTEYSAVRTQYKGKKPNLSAESQS